MSIAVLESMDKSIAEMCGKKAEAALLSCNDAAATLRTKLNTVEHEDVAACVLHMSNITAEEAFNQDVMSASASNFAEAQKRVWEVRVTNWLTDFGKAQLGETFDASKDVVPYTHVARLVSDKELRFGSTSSKFPWVSFGFSMLFVSFVAFAVKRVLVRRAENSMKARPRVICADKYIEQETQLIDQESLD